MVPTRLLLEGDDLAALLARVRGEHGPNVRIISAERVRSGGIAGFFTKERYEITVEVADPHDQPSKGMPSGLEELAALADRGDGATVFASALASAVNSASAPTSAATPMPVAAPMPAKTPAPAPKPLACESPGSFVNQPEPLASMIANFPTLTERVARLGEARHPAPSVRPIRSSIATTALPAHEYQPMPEATIQLPAGATSTPKTTNLVGRLVALGLPVWLAVRVSEPDSYSSILSVMADLPSPPQPPVGRGEVLVVLGDLEGAISTARSVLSALRLGPDSLAVAGHDALGVPASSRLSDPGDVARWVGELRSCGTGTGVIAVEVDLVLRPSDWSRSIIAAARASTVWAVVDASRKSADSARWLSSLGKVDALAVRGTNETVDPASVLTLGIPIATIDDRPATPHTWAGLLCERLAESEHANR